MRKIVYKKLDLKCVGTVLEGLAFEEMINLNVIPNFGGSVEDYGVIYTDLTNFHLENVNNKISIIDDSETLKQIELLKPSVLEIEKAERQIKLINDLTELGVI